VSVRPHVYPGARFIASVLASAALCACAAQRDFGAASAAKSCDVDIRSDWRYLEHAPANADALRATLWNSRPKIELHVEDREYWFANNDGAFMRCTLRLQPQSTGSSVMCSAVTTIFAMREGTWEPPLTLCITAEK
jgi:hypothetical protein